MALIKLSPCLMVVRIAPTSMVERLNSEPPSASQTRQCIWGRPAFGTLQCTKLHGQQLSSDTTIAKAEEQHQCQPIYYISPACTAPNVPPSLISSMNSSTFILNTHTIKSDRSQGCWPGSYRKASAISLHLVLHVNVTKRSGGPYTLHMAIASRQFIA